MNTAAGVALADMTQEEWSTLDRDDDPFTSLDYLLALESTGQVGPGTRWEPCHVAARSDDGALLGVLPLYQKRDSWGEFVFDFAWADAHQRAIGPYYPKLVTAVPYTPVGGRRVLVARDADADAVAHALIGAAKSTLDKTRASSWHIQFCHADERRWFEEANLLLRHDCQFHWFNRGYDDFEAFLGTFKSSRRKKTRRERRRVQEAGVRFETTHGDNMDKEAWFDFYRFYANSFLVRGREPYFTPQLFPELGRRLGRRIMIKTAFLRDEAVAAALFLHNDQRLYGRYWGCNAFVDALHFETCYYQGIEYCLEHGLSQFDPGTQGEHKIARGFQAHASYSAHMFREPGFHDAVAEFLTREGQNVNAYMEAVDQHLPFRAGESS
ncbi:MAG: GNAT family N-acetyltransferase [Pseudomonadota bacterium]